MDGAPDRLWLDWKEEPFVGGLDEEERWWDRICRGSLHFLEVLWVEGDYGEIEVWAVGTRGF